MQYVMLNLLYLILPLVPFNFILNQSVRLSFSPPLCGLFYIKAGFCACDCPICSGRLHFEPFQ